jgi:hypothetical protein
MDVAEARAGDRGLQRPRGLRYRVKMKKSIRKLVVRQETIRALASMDLARAAGGDVPQTGERVCTGLAVPPPPPGG